MTENQRLVQGQNPKTLLPIRYVAPIASEYWRDPETVVRGINAASGDPPADCDPQVSNLIISQEDLFSFPNVLYKPGYQGKVHLSNNGDQPLYSFSDCRFPVTSKEERRGDQDEVYVLESNGFGAHAIYDPRHYGFADKLGRVNESLGRVEYDYSEVDRIRIPHFLSRNQLDSDKLLNSVAVDAFSGNVNLNMFALENYTSSVIDQRTEMQNAWLERRKSDRVQQKLYPINKNGQYMGKG